MRGAWILGCFAVCAVQARASDQDFWYKFGEYGGPAFWAAGLGSSQIQDGRLGFDHSLRTGEGFLVAGALGEGLKLLTRERRPDGKGHDSFPSLHATLSFEVAAAQSYYHPGQAWAWYSVAGLIAASRVPAREHHWQDVVVGAALGFVVGHLAVSSRHGLFGDPSVDRGRSASVFGFSGKM